MENDFYLISCGRLLKYFLVIESLFLFCCVCSSSIWVLITPNPLHRFTMSVEYSQIEHQKLIIRDRIAFKRQM